MAFSYLESLIRRKVVNSTETDRKITAYLLTTDSRVVNLTITQLADRCGVSETSIYKYVKKLGFSGYQDFKIRVASNLHRQTPHDNISAAVNITNQDAPITIAKKKSSNPTSICCRTSTIFWAPTSLSAPWP